MKNLKTLLPGQTKILGATEKAIMASDNLTEKDLGAIKMILKVAKRLDDLYADPDTSRLVKESNLQFLYVQLLDKLLLTPASRDAHDKKSGVNLTEEEEELKALREGR